MNLSSENVKVFPIANRKNNTLSEENVTFMNSALYNGDGFVKSVKIQSDHLRCLFNIIGYTFDVKIPLNSVRDWENIYAGISLTDTNMISGQDVNGVYHGLKLGGTEDSMSGLKYIKIAVKSSPDDWEIPYHPFMVGNIIRIDGKRR